MKNKLAFSIISAMLCCSYLAAQQTAPAAVNAPYAGATIADFRGKVTVQLPAQTIGAPLRGEVLPPDTTVSTDDGRLLLRLSDGSDVLVRPHTKLVLKQPETSGWKYFQLLIGRVGTKIQKHLGGAPAFQMGTPSAVISVRGTKFDVEVDRRGFTQVDVEEGVVELEAATGRGESVLITAGFSSRVGMETGPEVPRPTQDLRPQLDRPNRRELNLSGDDDDDPLKRLLVSDRDRREGGDHHGIEPSGSDNGGHSSGEGGGGEHSGSDSDHSGSDDRGDGHHHSGGGKPPEMP